MNRTLENKVAVVTGGTTGIGLATAARLIEEGASVYVVGRRQRELDEAVLALGPNAHGVRADVSNVADLDALYERVRGDHGRLDVVVANAAILEPGPLAEMAEDSVDRMLAVNVKGLIFTVQKALPLLVDGASIVITASVDGIKGGPGRSAYASTKAAARNLARSWMLELAERRIRVNAVSPGVTETPGLAVLGGETAADEFFALLAEQSPVGRNVRPEEVADTIAYLASDRASGINGADIHVDAGLAQI
ncbi:SDR family NAD(P)-dependent oxidoreductase [Promicromonospora sp. NPDC090134]|uniref:SDR family NAD(P)-dependent oxidoreductase n=1 Tax=Promicromonospora sp. NPDC090134 TaxID=3364408 RepID=UPI0038094132